MGDVALAVLVILAFLAAALSRAGVLAVTLRKPAPRKPATTTEDPK